MTKLLYRIRHYMCYTLHWHSWGKTEYFKGKPEVTCKHCTTLKFL